MKVVQALRITSPLIAATLTGMLFGCANYEVNTGRGSIPGHYIRYEMQEADRAVETARRAGKDKECPAEFMEAEKAKDHAYDVFRSCHTEEGAALAKQATAKAQALCPSRPVVQAPVSPAPAAPMDNLKVSPAAIAKGQPATLSWTSQNSTNCEIQPGVGPVQTQGSMTITPEDTTDYTLICSGAGGTARSTTHIAVAAPAPEPVVVPAQPKAEATKLCSPTVIDIKFDTNKADIKPQFHDELKKLSDFLKEFPNAKGTIEGHTDNVGSSASNLKLSQRRADSVRNYIIKNFGIAADRISAKGYGLTKPVADNKTKAGKQTNRRIEANFKCE